MQCPRCQFDNRDGIRFCGECGARLDQICPACGAPVPPARKFCGECGEQLTATAPKSKPAATAPQVYTPAHLAERILTSRAALEGERKQVTVLFADLKGSMELLADRDPEEARAILDPILERMMEAVHRYEGTVNQVMGDGIMALFGAPLAHEDHAVRACYAALRMQESVKQYAEEVLRSQGIRPQIRVGLNSGEVVVRSIGSDLRMDYTAVGQTTHLAARMEQIAVPGSILLAPDTLRLVEGYVEVTALGPVPVKGLDEPVEIFEVLGAGPVRSRLQAAAARGLTQFVGRISEIEVLRHTLDRARDGHGQVVALVGEPGVGKSRLTWEFTHSHRAQDWLVLEGASVSYGKASSYLPVIDLLKSYCGIESQDDRRRMRQKLLGRVLDLDDGLRPSLPAFLALLDLPAEDAAWQALEPLGRRQRTLDACKRLLVRESQEQPVLLVFEDLHWIDTETQALLDSLVESVPSARMLLLVNYRPEYAHSWGRKTYYRQLQLDPLPPVSADELLRGLLGDDAELQPLKRQLIERTDGNPFFLEESIWTLVESGVLAGERGAYCLAKPVERAQVPATVQAVLAARIDRLAPEEKRLLQAAAVVGKDVPYALLQAIADEPEGPLRQRLTGLQAAEFLYETRLFPELEYTFKHALTHEVAYGSLLGERRRALHAQVVEAIERVYADRLAEHVERLAHHAFRGEVWSQAITYSRQAGLKAQARSANRESVPYFEQALVALGRLPPSHETTALAIDLRHDLHNSMVPLIRFEQVFENLTIAHALAESLDDERRLVWILAAFAQAFWARGEHDQVVAYGRRAVASATSLGDLGQELAARRFLGNAYHSLGDYALAIEAYTANVQAVERDLRYARFDGYTAPIPVSLGWLAVCHAERGEFDRASAAAEEAVRIADAVQHPHTVLQAYHRVGAAHVLLGTLDRAIAVLERGLRVCQEAEIPRQYSLLIATLGYAYALDGRIAEGLPLAERGMAQSPSSTRATYLAEVYLLAERADEALQTAERALALSRQHKERGEEARALRLLGAVAAHAEPPNVEPAEDYYCQALALADELGMRPLVAHCHLGLGTLYRKIDRDDEARAELTTAAEMYRAMEMTFWLARADAALAAVGD